MKSFHRREADCIHQGKLLISVQPDNIERFSLFSLPDTVNPRLTFVECFNNLERGRVSNAVEKQRVRFRNNVVGSKQFYVFPNELMDDANRCFVIRISYC